MEQPVTRRSFFQFTLALACAVQAEATSSPALIGTFAGRLQGETLVVSLKVRNDGAQPVEVLVRRGRANAVEIEASWDVWQARSAPETDSDLRTRAGPRLVWHPLAAKTDWDAGTFEVPLPPGSRDSLLSRPASLRATLHTHQGPLVLQKEIRVAAAP